MQIVFVHQNFPAQFGAFGAWLAARGWDVVFLTAATDARPPQGCRMVHVEDEPKAREDIAPTLRHMQVADGKATIYGRKMLALRDAHGLRPDLVMAHSGPGIGTAAKAIWPEAAYVPYLEWFYTYPPTDLTGTERTRPPEEDRRIALARSLPILADLGAADAALCPTRFQADRFPPMLRPGITVMHDGVDGARFAPDPAARMDVAGLALPEDAEVVTYATRGMEPHRGFPQAMRLIAELQARRPGLHAVIAGNDRVAYGRKLREGDSWKRRMLAELELDEGRLHFTGLLAPPDYTRLLQATDLHLYYTVPFVLSWSLIEAMMTGAPILASDAAPVREALEDGRTALLVDHDDHAAALAAAERLLDDADLARRLRAAARAEALARYDSRWLWPARRAWLTEVARRAKGA